MAAKYKEAERTLESAVMETVRAKMSQEELEFGSLPGGELLGRYALESFMELVASGAYFGEDS